LQQIEQSDRVSETHFKIFPDSLPQMFQAANLREQRKERFNQPAVVPFTAPTQFQVFRLIRFAAKTVVRQNNHSPAHFFDERQEILVGNVRRFYRPIGNESEFIGQKTEFSANNPTPRGETFAADSAPVGLMIFTNRVTQFNPVRVNYAEDGWLGKKLFSQLAMRFQTTEKSGAFRQIGKQVNPVLPNPAIKLVLRSAFQCQQQSQSHQFAQGKLGLNVFLRLRQHIIYTTEKFYDKVFLSHGIGFSL
jgi:hypothetical protein